MIEKHITLGFWREQGDFFKEMAAISLGMKTITAIGELLRVDSAIAWFQKQDVFASGANGTLDTGDH